MKKKILSSVLCLSMLLAMLPTQAMADDTFSAAVVDGSVVMVETEDTSVSVNTTPAVLTAQGLVYDITVPTSLPIYVDNEGTVTVSDSYEIVNESVGAVKVSNVEVEAENGWSLVSYDKDFTQEKVDLQEVGFVLNGDYVNTDGSISLEGDWDSIDGNGGVLPLIYDANVATQSSAITDNTIATITYTVDWNTGVNEDNDTDGGETFSLLSVTWSGTSACSPVQTNCTVCGKSGINRSHSLITTDYDNAEVAVENLSQSLSEVGVFTVDETENIYNDEDLTCRGDDGSSGCGVGHGTCGGCEDGCIPGDSHDVGTQCPGEHHWSITVEITSEGGQMSEELVSEIEAMVTEGGVVTY